jgi:hypothetical protein
MDNLLLLYLCLTDESKAQPRLYEPLSWMIRNYCGISTQFSRLTSKEGLINRQVRRFQLASALRLENRQQALQQIQRNLRNRNAFSSRGVKLI